MSVLLSVHRERSRRASRLSGALRTFVQEEFNPSLPDAVEQLLTPLVARMGAELNERVSKVQEDVGASQRQFAAFMAQHTEAGVRSIIDATLLPTVDARFSMYDDMLRVKLEAITAAARGKFDDLDATILTLQTRLAAQPAQEVPGDPWASGPMRFQGSCGSLCLWASGPPWIPGIPALLGLSWYHM